MTNQDKLILANLEEKIEHFYKHSPRNIVGYVQGLIIAAKRADAIYLPRLEEIREEYKKLERENG